MTLSSRFASAITAFVTMGAMLLPSATLAANAPSAAFSPGDLIKSSANASVYYYASNGKRYVFPNEKTYFSWYPDFSNIKVLSVAQLGVLPILSLIHI